MVAETQSSCDQYIMVARRKDSKEQRAWTYTILVLSGMLQAMVQWLMEREKGGVYHTQGACIKTGETVLEVI